MPILFDKRIFYSFFLLLNPLKMSQCNISVNYNLVRLRESFFLLCALKWNSISLTLDVLVESLRRQQREAHRFQDFHHMLLPVRHVVVQPVHSSGEHLILVFDPELLAAEQLHQLIFRQAWELFWGAHLTPDTGCRGFKTMEAKHLEPYKNHCRTKVGITHNSSFLYLLQVHPARSNLQLTLL